MNWVCLGAMAVIYTIEPLLWLRSMESAHRVHINSFVFVISFAGYYFLTGVKQYFMFQGASEVTTIELTVVFLLYICSITFFLFQNNFKCKLMFLGVFLICNLSTEIICIAGAMLLFRVGMTEIASYGWLNVVCTLESKMLLSVLCYILFFLKERRSLDYLYSNAELLPLLVSAVLFEIPFSVVFRYSDRLLEKPFDLSIFVLIQIYIILLVCYIILITYRYQENLNELRCELQKKHNACSLSNQILQLRHDMSFYKVMLLNFIQKEQYDELKKFVGGITEEMADVEDVFVLSDQTVANTLNMIAQEAKKRKIRFEHIIMVSDFIISSKDVSKLLFNILHNAMEAVEELEDERRKITLEMSRRQAGYHINCVNPYLKRDGFAKELFTTSKDDKRNHGKGFTIVKQIVEQNGGIIKMQIHDTLFEIDCFIPDKGRWDAK